MRLTKSDIEDKIKDAMRNKDTVSRDIFRMTLNAINTKEFNTRRKSTPDDVQDAIVSQLAISDTVLRSKPDDALSLAEKSLLTPLVEVAKVVTPEVIESDLKELITANGFSGAKDIKPLVTLAVETKGYTKGDVGPVAKKLLSRLIS